MLMQEQSNPYQFIVDTDHTKKKLRGPAGNSKKSRILIVLGGLLALVIIAMIVMAVISRATSAGNAELVKAAQKQTELVRVSKIGLDRATGTSAKNLATSVNITLQSDQIAMSSTLKAAGAQASPAELALGKNAKTDTALTNAEQSNKFDEVFITTIQAQLVEYQKLLKAAHDKSDSKKVKQSLATQFESAGLLATAKQ